MKTKTLFTFLIGILLMIGCSKTESNTAGMGSLSIELTDAPFPHDMIAEANVTIFKIEARYHGAEDDNSQGDSDMNDDSHMDEDNGSSYVVLMEDEITVNLLDLTNGVTETLVDTDIPVGEYDLFRVYVRDASIVLNDENSTTYDLKFPSGEQSGVKVFIKPALAVTSGLSADLLFDFDVCSSFVPRGNLAHPGSFNGFNFKPVIKVSNLTTAGTLQGGVSTLEDTGLIPLEGVQISVMQEGELITTTFSGENGGYMVMGLDPGTYEVMAELEGYQSQTIESIQISAGNYTSVDFDLLAKE